MSKTTIYLIRHSIRFSDSFIEEYRTVQSELVKSEKSVLSVEGEKRAEILARQEELQHIDKVYVSNCVRTLQTAKYLLAAQNLPVTIDERFDERRFGIPNTEVYPNWYSLQYLDENFKTVGGECQKEVRERFEEAFKEVLNFNRGKRIAIFAHGYSITFFLMKWLKLEGVNEERKLTFSFHHEIIFDKKLEAPEVFKLVIDDNVIEISNLEVDYSI